MATRRASNARAGSAAETEMPGMEAFPDGDGHAGSEELAETRSLPVDRLDGKVVEIGGERFIIGRVSLDQVAAIARLGLRAARTMPEDSKENLRELAQGANVNPTMANVETLFSVFDGPVLNSLFGIVLDRDAEWVRKHVDFVTAVDIVEAVLEQNEVSRLQAAFLRLGKLFSNSTQTSE